MINGTVAHICTSPTKGVKKRPVAWAHLRDGSGLEGDAHAGPWHRQVSLLDVREIEAMRQRGLAIGPGVFAENIGVEGIELGALGLGSRLRLGESAELRISQIGKVCHARCAIYEQAGDCIMPRAGIFARVVREGRIEQGDPVEVLEAVGRALYQAVVLTISDRCSRGAAEDTAGPAVAALLRESGAFHVYRERILPDDTDPIDRALRHYAGGHGIELILTVGGTGFAPRDVTPEVTREVIERPTPGIDEAMRQASLARTPHAMFSRGVSGIRGATLIVNLPGSRRAATENLAVILPALPHGLAKLRGDPSNCDPSRAQAAASAAAKGHA